MIYYHVITIIKKILRKRTKREQNKASLKKEQKENKKIPADKKNKKRTNRYKKNQG